MSAEDAVEALVSVIIELLRSAGEEIVATRLSKDLDRLLCGDRSALNSILAEVTGGAGSLNDFIVSAASGAPPVSAISRDVNSRLRGLIEDLRARLGTQ